MVGVESLAGNHPLAVHEDVVGDVIDVRMAGDVLLLPIVNLQLAEHLRGAFELVRFEVLFAHDQHVMLGKGAIENGAGFGVDRLR